MNEDVSDAPISAGPQAARQTPRVAPEVQRATPSTTNTSHLCERAQVAAPPNALRGPTSSAAGWQSQRGPTTRRAQKHCSQRAERSSSSRHPSGAEQRARCTTLAAACGCSLQATGFEASCRQSLRASTVSIMMLLLLLMSLHSSWPGPLPAWLLGTALQSVQALLGARWVLRRRAHC